MRLPHVLAPVVLVIGISGVASPTGFDIIGNSELSDESILKEIGKVTCVTSDSACIDSVCHHVARLYWRCGYLDAKVGCKTRTPSGDTIEISVSEGQLSMLRSVSIGGAPAGHTAALEEMFSDQIGRPFSQRALEDGISAGLRFYDARGYPLSTIEPEMVSAGDGWVGIRLRVRAGPKADVGHIVLNGLRKTRREAVLPETGLTEGQPYDGEKIESVSRRLMDLGIFEDISDPVLTFDSSDTTITVSIDVVEARTSLVEGMAAYVPSGSQSKFVGSLDLEFRNLAGTLRRLRVLWMRPGTGRLSWSVGYREPRILSKPFALECQLSADVIDTSYARRKLWLGLTFRGEPRLEFGVGGFLGATKDRSIAGGEGNFQERGLSFNFRYDGRDEPINPLSGQLFELTQEVASLEYDDDSSLDRTISMLSVGAEHLTAVGTRISVAVGAIFKGVFSSEGEIPNAHRIRVGGMRTLRGYPEEWFSVDKAMGATFEVRRLLGSYSRVYVFFDGATLEGGGYSLGAIRSAPFGYGLGFMAGSRSGIVRLEIALGRDDTWSEAKLHLGLVRRF